MATLEYIVFGTSDPSYVAVLADNNTFTGTNTFNVVNGTVGTITTLASGGTATLNVVSGTIGTINSFSAVTYAVGTVAGIDSTVSIQDMGTVTHTLTFDKGILTAYATA